MNIFSRKKTAVSILPENSWDSDQIGMLESWGDPRPSAAGDEDYIETLVEL